MMMKSCEIDYDNPPDLSKAIVSVNEVPLGVRIIYFVSLEVKEREEVILYQQFFQER